MTKHFDIDNFIDQLIDGDCNDVLPEFPTASVDCIFLDPPLINPDYKDKLGYDEDVLEHLFDTMQECVRILKSGGSLWITGPWKFTPRLYILCEDLKLHPQNEIIFAFTKGTGSRWRFSYRHQTMYWFTKGADQKDFKWNIDDIRIPYKHKDPQNNILGMNPGDVWTVTPVHGNSLVRYEGVQRQLPEIVVMRAILACTDPGGIVLDPMCGSGTVIQVADKCNRHWIGIDTDSGALDFTTERLDMPFDGWDSADVRANRITKDRDWTVNTKVDIRAKMRNEDPFENRFDWSNEEDE